MTLLKLDILRFPFKRFSRSRPGLVENGYVRESRRKYKKPLALKEQTACNPQYAAYEIFTFLVLAFMNLTSVSSTVSVYRPSVIRLVLNS
jgi:hypothetical protein